MFQFRLKIKTCCHHLQQAINLDANFRSITGIRDSSTVLDYLTKTLGFSSESALQVSKKIRGKSTSNPHLVHSLFQNYGFAPNHISHIVTRCPHFLFSDPEKNLKPKLEFLTQNGISGQHLVTAITINPRILQRSLDRQIIPSIGFLKTFLGSTSALISQFSVRRGTCVVVHFSDSMAVNVETLRQHRVPEANILKMITVQARVLSRDAQDFKKAVVEVQELGFDPSSMMFIHGVYTLCSMRKDKWASKFEVFKSFGWSEAEFRALFLKQPPVLRSSEKRLRRALDFFTNKVGWGVLEIAKNPTMLSLSFEKRILPRWSIIQILIDKAVIAKRTTIGKGFMLAEDKFVGEFLKEYEEHVPRLLQMYRKKLQGL